MARLRQTATVLTLDAPTATVERSRADVHHSDSWSWGNVQCRI